MTALDDRQRTVVVVVLGLGLAVLAYLTVELLVGSESELWTGVSRRYYTYEPLDSYGVALRAMLVGAVRFVAVGLWCVASCAVLRRPGARMVPLDDRQRVVVVVASGLALIAAVLSLEVLEAPTLDQGWFMYAPNNGVLLSPGDPGWTLRRGLQWLVAVLVWGVLAVRIVRRRTPRDGDPSP